MKYAEEKSFENPRNKYTGIYQITILRDNINIKSPSIHDNCQIKHD